MAASIGPTSVTLEKAFKDRRLPRLFKINFQIQDAVSTKMFKIGDGSNGTFYLEILDPKHSSTNTYIKSGNFVKVVNPTLRKEDHTIILDKKSIIYRGEAIPGIEKVNVIYQSLASTLELESGKNIPGKILAKVVQIYEPLGPYPSKYGGMRWKHTFQIKDIDDAKQSMGIWKPNNLSPVEIGKSYVFSHVKTDNYQKSKPYMLIGDENGDSRKSRN